MVCQHSGPACQHTIACQHTRGVLTHDGMSTHRSGVSTHEGMSTHLRCVNTRTFTHACQHVIYRLACTRVRPHECSHIRTPHARCRSKGSKCSRASGARWQWWAKPKWAGECAYPHASKLNTLLPPVSMPVNVGSSNSSSCFDFLRFQSSSRTARYPHPARTTYMFFS